MKLEGVRVIDLSQFLPGPTLTQVMADHGAAVIKVENTGAGEPVRNIGQRRRHRDRSVYFDCTHRGKQSIAIDLKQDAGREALLTLCRDADVVVESFRPGVVDRLGVGYEQVRAVREDIVYVSISAWGQDGPLLRRPAHDLAVQAELGLLRYNATAAGEPVLPAMPSSDMLAATLGLSGVMMALYRRSVTGRGDYLDLSMMDALLACMPNSMGAVFGEQREPEPAAERIWGGAALYRIYGTADDRHLALAGSEPRFARNLLTALGREDLIEAALTPPGAGQAPVVAFLTETFAARPLEHWRVFLDGIDVCWGPVNGLLEGLAGPQLAHRKMVLHDDAGEPHIGLPLKFRDEPGRARLDSPAAGAHGPALLAAAGYDADRIRALVDAGVVRIDDPV